MRRTLTRQVTSFVTSAFLGNKSLKSVLLDETVKWADVDEDLSLFASHKQWVLHVSQQVMRDKPVDTIRDVGLVSSVMVRLHCHPSEQSNRRDADPESQHLERIVQRDELKEKSIHRFNAAGEETKVIGGTLAFEVLANGLWSRRPIECESADDLIDNLRAPLNAAGVPLHEENEDLILSEINRLQREAARNDFMKDANQLKSRGEGLVSLSSPDGVGTTSRGAFSTRPTLSSTARNSLFSRRFRRRSSA